MKVLESAFAQSFAKFADDGWKQGYHERNGGNLSYRIPTEYVEAVKEDLDFSRPWQEIGTEVPDLAGEFFMVTGTGRFFRHVKDDTINTCGIIEVDETGTRYRILWGYADGGRPTSELPPHLMNLEVKKKLNGGKTRVVYHCHPVNLIALTFVLPLTDAAFTKELWQFMTECPVIFPDGIGVLPWMVCGSKEIGIATSEKMKEYNAVVWSHHGIFVAGSTFDETFGLCHTIEKSAEIAVKLRSMQPTKRQTMTKPMFEKLAKAFRLNLAEKFLR